MATYVIGDVQGCFSYLQQLLEKIAFNVHQDCLWFVGDIINRGPESLLTLRFIKAMCEAGRAVMVLGNHDLALLAVGYGTRASHPADTHHDILNAPDCLTLLDWLRHQPFLHCDQTLGYVMTHAGIPPQWSITQTTQYANEVNTALRGDHYVDFLAQIFGNAHIWSDTLIGIERLQYIVNALTRMRFCSEQGELDLKTKSIPTLLPGEVFKPWYAWPSRFRLEQKIVFGHWAALEGRCDTPNIFATDTGCAWGCELTAMCLETQIKYSISCRK